MKKFFKLHRNLITELSLLAAAAFSVAVGGINIYILIFSVLMHELGHICTALLLGAKTENFALHGFGVEITFPGKTPTPKNMLMISAGGPAMSLIIAAIAYFINNQLLLTANLSISIINLLPVYPLDGGNILSSVLSNYFTRNKIRKIIKFFGRFFGILISFCGICILYISTFNISLLYMGLFIFFSAEKSPNPVVEITSAHHPKIEKCSVYSVDGSLSLIEAAVNLPVNSIGAVKDSSGKITSLITPLYLCNLAVTNEKCTDNLGKIKKSRP